MAVTRFKSLHKQSVAAVARSSRAVQAPPQQTKKGIAKPKKKSKKNSAGKAIRNRKIGVVQVVAQQEEPSTDTQLPSRMVSIPTDVVNALNNSAMKHFIVNDCADVKEEVDESVDNTLSQSAINSSAGQEPLQRDSTPNSIKFFDSILLAVESVEQNLSAHKMNDRPVGDCGIPRYSDGPQDDPSCATLETQTNLKKNFDCIAERRLSVSQQGVASERIGADGSHVLEIGNHTQSMHLCPATTVTKSELEFEYLSVTSAITNNELQVECSNPIKSQLEDQGSSPSITNNELEVERSNLIISESEDQGSSPPKTMIRNKLEYVCSAIIKSEFDDEPPSPMITNSELGVQCPSPARTIIKGELEDDNLSPTSTIIKCELDLECLRPIISESKDQRPIPSRTIINNELEDDCSTSTIIKRELEDEPPSPMFINSELKVECPSPARTIIKSELEDECLSPFIISSDSEDRCLSPTRTIIKNDCASPMSTTSINAENEVDDLDLLDNFLLQHGSRNVGSDPTTEAVHNGHNGRHIHRHSDFQSIRRRSATNSQDHRENVSSHDRGRAEHKHKKCFTKRRETSNSTTLSSSSYKSFSGSQRSVNKTRRLHNASEYDTSFRERTSKRKRLDESDSERNYKNDLQRPRLERDSSKRSPPSNKCFRSPWSDHIRFSTTPERSKVEGDTTNDSEPDYGWMDPPPPKKKCVESTRELDPNVHAKMQMLTDKINTAYDLDVVEESKKELVEAIDEFVSVQLTKKLKELDQRIQKTKDDYICNLFGTDDFENWDDDPALGNVETIKKMKSLKSSAVADATLLDKMTMKHWQD